MIWTFQLSQASVLLCLIVLGSSLEHVESFEPITTGIAAGTAAILSSIFAGYELVKCKLYECCEEPWVHSHVTGIESALSSRLHGQHLVVDTVVKAIKGHVRNPKPEKALVLSFHGWTGGGKNFVSRIIAEHLFEKGMESKFVNLFVATLHFPHMSKLQEYQDQLRSWIHGNVSVCQRTLFIFDEMDKLPIGLVDTVKPYIDHYPEIQGVDFRKSMFLFLSNTAGNDITKQALAVWQAGRKRETITLNEMEETVTMATFNEAGGLWHTTLIEKHLISQFIPFLPLERHHIKSCIRDDLIAKGHSKLINEETISKIADELLYFPPDTKLYSKSGCKRVSQKVDLYLEYQ